MKAMLLKALINLIMIEAVLVLTSAHLAIGYSMRSSIAEATVLIFMALALASLIPALAISLLFAYVEKKKLT